MSFILQNVGLAWKGPAQVPFPELVSNANILPTDAIIFRWKDLLVIGVTVPLLVALSYFIGSTKQGRRCGPSPRTRKRRRWSASTSTARSP